LSTAQLSFLPWVRQGAAAAITTPDTLGSAQPAVAGVAAELRLNGASVPGITVRLRGPADVVGLDPNQVLRTDPAPGTVDFEANAFASIEFDRPDLPWLFTPARAAAQSRLRPWLCLVVVRRQEGITISSAPGLPLPVLQIDDAAVAARELPDLREAWAWAHAQAAPDEATQQGVAAALNGPPEQSLSRLVCPRLLSPHTDYVACVVPTFELGRRTGLGMAVSEADITAQQALAPAWPPAPPAAMPLRLPVYYRWEFRTGEGGDFAALVRRLRPAAPSGLGRRPIDIGQPGFDAEGAGPVVMEGPLLPLAPVGPDTAPVPRNYRTRLAEILNVPPEAPLSEPAADPVLAPPTYGRWHAGRASVAVDGNTWLDQLNLDPCSRVAAGLGTRVVQEHQEALMASAWEQAGDLAPANQRLRQLQLGLAVSESLQQRHFAGLGEEMMLRFAAPTFARLEAESGVTLLTEQAGSRLPLGANGWAMRRIGRPRGPLGRRVRVQVAASATAAQPPAPTTTWLARMNGTGSSAATSPAPVPARDMALMPSLPTEHLATASNFGVFFVAAEAAAVVRPGEPVFLAGRTELPGHFRAAMLRHLTVAAPAPAQLPAPQAASFEGVGARVMVQMAPATAYAALARALVSSGGSAALAGAGEVNTVMVAPRFPQPMAEALRDLSPELLLPGLDQVPPDSVVGLQTNRRFVEAYLVGLNHEMARELLWRGFPTDQRGTCFAHFWGSGGPGGAPPEIGDLHLWAGRALGDAAGAPAGAAFVMLLRSALLRRYPNAVVYLAPAVAAPTAADPAHREPDLDPAHEYMPLFSGTLPPDVAYFGFGVPTEVATGADGGLGCFVVLQEHPTAPRFGLDAGLALGAASHLAIGTAAPPGVPLHGRTWGGNAAEMAAITRRMPVRLAIHASRLMTRP
jgi:hypothetical protein